MKLIDADNLMYDIRNTITEQSSTLDWLNLINRQPTAYDVDAVVEKLEDEEKQSYADFEEYAENFGLDEDDDWYYMGLKRAIEIVKGGGVDA